MKRTKARSFTLIEMMVVVLIVGIVATVVTLSVGDKPDIAKAKATGALIAKLQGEVQLFKGDQNRYPESLKDLVLRPAQVDVREWPEHGYLLEVPKDGWDRPFRYACPSVRGPFDIVSLGAEDQEDGLGVNADRWSHPPQKRILTGGRRP